MTSGRKAKPISAQATQPSAFTRCARRDGRRRQYICETTPIQAAMIAESPMSGRSTSEAKAPPSTASEIPRKP